MYSKSKQQLEKLRPSTDVSAHFGTIHKITLCVQGMLYNSDVNVNSNKINIDE